MGANKRVDIKTGFICNNNCRFCVQAHNKFKGNRSFEEIKKDLIDARKRCNSVVLTGGEVTIRKDFFDIVKLAKKLNYKTIQIQTNGRMFASLDFCKKTIKAGANEFSPALHGYCAEQHDSLTKAPGSFAQTTKGIKNLKSLGTYVLTNTVVVKKNYKDLPKIAKLLVKLNVDQFQFAFVHPIGNAWKNFNSVVPKISLASPYIKKGLEIGIKAGKSVMAEAMPYCLMREYEDYVSEKFIPETEIIDGNTIIEDYKSVRIKQGKSKFSQCKNCKYNLACEGPWKEYPQKLGNKEFKPNTPKLDKKTQILYIKKLASRDIAVPKMINSEKSRCLQWMPGINLKSYLDQHPEKYKGLCKKVARLQGKVHRKKIISLKKEKIKKEVIRKIEKKLRNSKKDLNKYNIYKKTKEILEKHFPKKFIPDIIHGDFWFRNILINRNQLYLIDFENICQSFLEIDILHNFFDNRGSTFIEEYKKQNDRTKKVYHNLIQNKLFYRIYHLLMTEGLEKLKKVLNKDVK
ncbi:radical SAM protein [Candidatus Woesearchaeota archaeon]|nr:radical SAM protein [Candidatus Woesearchaeota archaeon]